MAAACSGRGLTVLLLLAISVVGKALTPSTFLTTVDQARLKSVFQAAQPYQDVASAHYSILGLQLLGGTLPNAQDTCKIISAKVDTTSPSSLYHASLAAKVLGSCKLNVGNVQDLLSSSIKDEAAVADIFYAYFALKNLGLKVDKSQVTKSLLESLKKDDSALSYGYAFLVASDTGDTDKFFDSIEDIIAQADEVDEKYLQFEGGLFATSLVVDGAYKLADKAKKAPTISQDKVIKFANYFLSRKHVHQLRSAYYFLSVIKTLTDNKYHIPIAVTLASPVAVSQASPQIEVRVTNLMGGSLGTLTVTADSARHLGDEAIVLSKKPFKASSSDKSLYELDFMKAKPARGFYKLIVSVNPQKSDSRLIGTTGAEVDIKVTSQVSIENVEIGVSDKDQTSAPRTTKLVHPKKASNPVEADYHQKIIMKFQLRDKTTSELVTAHQAFVRLTNLQTKQEIIFVTESDEARTYKFDLDVGSSAKDFGHLSGKYSMELIVGDSVIENPFSWLLADVKLMFPEGAASEKEAHNQYAKRPEIKHVFREEEKRPPSIISMTFTVLVLLPILILVIIWVKLGANISNFPMSLSAVGFHGCLAGIFLLYYCYWTNLNMFQTLRWLSILAIPTFLFGNRLLSALASKRKTT
ncbi:dolichyl-diphosphooligosaccharide--protein glycosyltransferase subunit 2-like [Gigantopelta aegis]|uniref:dolichyl-diphosphooligosaccharide--protein glycosyltransferase subunit 2-like n=1 Tax=Gigantopelta aegis TaxID=1735272 RepID=UPI001B888E7E|nr:dolichyl-diphosphooligosaccharide--protein glycosyltransferase subunit 2-like [Gigantopelta aegis]